MIYHWQITLWQQITQDLTRLPHALLFAGPAGGGKGDFARALANRLLCESVGPDGFACRVCDPCRWFAAGHHPDMRAVRPEADIEGEAEPDKKSAKSTQIRIDQIRALAEFLSVGAVRGGRRVVLIQPAEAMNAATANSLLKLLEEPPPSTQFILVSDSPRRLLPTLRSRCQQWAFAKPERGLATRWLADQSIAEPAGFLDFAGGMPLAARDQAAQAESLARFVKDITSLPKTDPLALAAQWETWVKAKAVDGSAMDIPRLALWLQKWVFDLLLIKQAGRVKFYSTHQPRLAAIAEKLPLVGLTGCYNALTQMHRVAEHPLNPRLFLDDMLLRYARLLG